MSSAKGGQELPNNLMKKYKPLNKIRLPAIILVSILFIVVSIFPVRAKTVDEVGEEIEQKEEELSQLEEDLENAQDNVAYYKNAIANSGSEIERIENEIKLVEAEIALNEADLSKQEEELNMLELELEQNQLVIDNNIIDYYIYNRQGVIDVFVENGEVDGFWKDYKYRETLIDSDLEDLTSLARELEDRKSERDEILKSITALEEDNDRLASRKKELEDQKAYYASMASYNTNIQSGIRSQMGAVQQQIEGLTAEQQKLIEEEKRIIENAHGGTQPLVPGEYYFYGQGRSLYQGHGLGFSQYGAKGGGQHGMSGDSIAKFYYSGSSIGTASGSVHVVGDTYYDGYVDKTIDVEIYVAGLGEVPDYVCGTQAQYETRPDKYRVYNPNLWEGGCWPEAAIEAQVIVARSFALAYGGTICTTARCQLYKGGHNKRWAADETNGKVLKVGGGIIKAYYSSDNNNGWGTGTHRNPVWCWDFAGNCGGGYSWLQSVNDSSFAAKGPYTDWMWRTNSYTLGEIQSMFEWYAGHGYSNSGSVQSVLNTIGTFQDFSMQRDASGRVARINVMGSSGSTTINGEIFKEIFNLWVGNKVPSGEVDPVFSLTYHFRKV
jgi:SpoIID/LytB domain protein